MVTSSTCSRFFADCFEGQIITCIVIVIFVAAFLLREWIIQNTPAELEGGPLDIDEVEAPPMNMNDFHHHPLPVVDVDANNNNVQPLPAPIHPPVAAAGHPLPFPQDAQPAPEPELHPPAARAAAIESRVEGLRRILAQRQAEFAAVEAQRRERGTDTRWQGGDSNVMVVGGGVGTVEDEKIVEQAGFNRRRRMSTLRNTYHIDEEDGEGMDAREGGAMRSSLAVGAQLTDDGLPMDLANMAAELAATNMELDGRTGSTSTTTDAATAATDYILFDRNTSTYINAPLFSSASSTYPENPGPWVTPSSSSQMQLRQSSADASNRTDINDDHESSNPPAVLLDDGLFGLGAMSTSAALHSIPTQMSFHQEYATQVSLENFWDDGPQGTWPSDLDMVDLQLVRDADRDNMDFSLEGMAILDEEIQAAATTAEKGKGVALGNYEYDHDAKDIADELAAITSTNGLRKRRSSVISADDDVAPPRGVVDNDNRDIDATFGGSSTMTTSPIRRTGRSSFTFLEDVEGGETLGIGAAEAVKSILEEGKQRQALLDEAALRGDDHPGPKLAAAAGPVLADAPVVQNPAGIPQNENGAQADGIWGRIQHWLLDNLNEDDAAANAGAPNNGPPAGAAVAPMDNNDDDWLGNNNGGGNGFGQGGEVAAQRMGDVQGGLMDEDEEEENAGDDLDGVLEAIGMRGSLWMLVQNSALMALLISLCLAAAVWVPYTVGKTVLLIKPLDTIYFPLIILRRVTDPLVDLVLDTLLPYFWRLLSPYFALAVDAASPYVTPFLAPVVTNSTLSTVQDGARLLTNRSMSVLMYVAGLTSRTANLSSLAGNNTVAEPLVVTTGNDNVISGVVLVYANSIANAFNLTLPDFTLENFERLAKEKVAPLLLNTANRWHGFANGNSPTDRIVCVLVGYLVLVLLGTWYLSRTRNAYGRTVGRAVQQAIRQQGIILKVAFFVAIELVIFPIVCGVLLDLSTLPIFPNATPWSRLEFYLEAPVTSIFLHWFLGTGFMFHFAVFVALCREIVRPGVMWFIRDPNDPQFHPIKEILERPVFTQLKKIGASGLMYSAMIFFGIGSVVYFVGFLLKGVLPLHWSFTEPLSEFPVDLLIFHIVVPVTISYAKPKHLFKTLFKNWWRLAAQQLRMTSFMFGGRYPEEEGAHVRKTWWAWITRQEAPIPGTIGDLVDDSEVSIEAVQQQNQDVYFARDGGLVRAPFFDGVPVKAGRRMLIPVNEQGEALEEEDRRLGHPASDGAPDNLHTTVVYVPPNFRRRVIIFLFLMWFSGSLFACSITIAPLIVGRYFFKNYLTPGRTVHDIYSFTFGLYVMWAVVLIVEWCVRRYRTLKRNNWRVDIHVVARKAKESITMMSKLAYLLVAFGVVIPFLLGLLVELYIIMPLKTPVTEAPVIFFFQDWALGIMYMKIIHRILMMLPPNDWQRAITAITARGVCNLNVKIATKAVIAPVLAVAIGAMVLPALLAWAGTVVFAITEPTKYAAYFRLAYPSVLAIIVFYRLQYHGIKFIKGWIQSIRDEEYLIGRQLHNLDGEQSATTIVPQ
ncbi:hypothetical protein BC938DRAFT_478246 [Jimgerdemannia flammicorona]|uniref:RING-type E3 ubiquitin transferase n=1 Tax=Jimgerdemannia flammicorona TaxID=994334 RepID=A0A433QN76_9FUNG|nr:hypothetical protein BC938DRAFT_478246 [Jimgerdemannia flammicorona]